MVDKKRNAPITEREQIDTVDGLSLVRNITETVTFTLDQLKRVVLADKPLMVGISRDDGLKVLSGLIRHNRLELFGTLDGYRIITNGYGQLKEVRFSHSNPASAEEIFDMLERCLTK